MSPPELTSDFRLWQATQLLDQDPAAAVRAAKSILQENPANLAAALVLGSGLCASGDPAAAIDALRVAIEIHPENAVLRLELGRALLGFGRREEALIEFEHAVVLQPGLADGWRELSRIYAANHDMARCDSAYARFDALTPGYPHLKDARAAIVARRFGLAESLLLRRLGEVPQDVEAIRMLAQVAFEREDYAEVERLLTDCLCMEPGFARARFELAVAYHAQQKPALVLPLAERLLQLEPRDFQYRSLRASALAMLGDSDRANQMLAELTAEQPANSKAWLNFGHALRIAGALDSAVSAYRKSIEVMPTHGEAYFSLANLKTFRFSPDEVAAMQAQLERAELTDDERLHFEFALAKACEDGGDYVQAYGHYVRGNELRRAAISYDASETTSQVARARTLYTSAFFTERADWGSAARDPIFIVGLPRSGSTLLEQILASHSQVEGTRELPDVPGFAYELGARKLRRGAVGYPESVGRLTREQALSYGERYLAQTRPHRRLGVARFIDKMPNNFMNIGLIHLMLPNSRIIDARRHPLACCFANFKQHFQKGLLFTYTLEEVARFYADYVTLMNHFDEVLPGRVHRVYYESLVAQPEQELRGLLEYCQLPYETGCLRFHENRRAVQTASSEQVRRPIYSEGVDHWRHFESWLGPLKSQLGDLIDSYPGGRSCVGLASELGAG